MGRTSPRLTSHHAAAQRAVRVLSTSACLFGVFACGPRKSGETDAPTPRRAAPPAAGTTDDLHRSPSKAVEQYITKWPGVTVSTAGDGGISIRIRGGSSLLGNNEPLFIVDGVPFVTSPNGSLIGINPNDIDTIRVLKDPADLTMYGSRGANGVILIRTKRAVR